MGGVRRCGVCGDVKRVDEFAWRRKALGQRDNMCRLCRSDYKRQHYLANKQRYIDQARIRKEVRRLERTRYLIDYFKSHPCICCGETDPIVLEFDHIATKSFAVTAGLPDRRWQAILDEMEKCEVVCANCHRRRTARRRGALRAILTEP
jgi:hypothetical protein